MSPAATDLDALRRRLGPLGVWVFSAALDEDPGEVARWIENLGYTAVWVGGGNPDPADFARLERMLSGSDRLVVATGIVNLWAWQPAALATEAARLHAAFPGRFLLGIGVSHAPIVERLGQRYERPLDAMVAFLDALDGATATGGGATGGGAVPRVLAALGDRMLRLSADRALGAHPYLTTPPHTERARGVLGPGPVLAPEQAIVLDEDPERARSGARAYLERYLRLPNYAHNLRRLGWSEEDLQGGGTDALVDAVVLHGGIADVAAGVRAHLAGGADHVCIQPLTAAGAFDRDALERLAPALHATPTSDPPPGAGHR